tara:strand:- start:1512 stop:2375 length:864 start_codon:yes stop_codon:yes gene_type:complete
MKTVNSISGGKTSAYIAANYPADYNVFALVRTDDKKCMFPDAKLRQVVSDKIGKEFIGTLEDDMIIHTILDLEQFIGQEISWVSGKTFDEINKKKNGKTFIPQANRRICTQEMKIIPIAEWWYKNISTPIEMRIGFRANEMRRAKTMQEKTNKNGLQSNKFKIGKSKNGNNKWKEIEWRKPTFPLIEDAIFKDNIVEFWKNKKVRFAFNNNCIGCFHAEPLFLKHQSLKHPNKFNWFIEQEKKSMKDYKGRTWLMKKLTYEQIKNYKTQIELFDDDFNGCDSGSCGL